MMTKLTVDEVIFVVLALVFVIQMLLVIKLITNRRCLPLKSRYPPLLCFSGLSNTIYLCLIILAEVYRTAGKEFGKHREIVLFWMAYISPVFLLVPHIFRGWKLRVRFLKPAQRQKLKYYVSANFLSYVMLGAIIICIAVGLVSWFLFLDLQRDLEHALFHEDIIFGLMLFPFLSVSLWTLIKIKKIKRTHKSLSEIEWVLTGIILMTGLAVVRMVLLFVWDLTVWSPPWMGSVTDLLFLFQCFWTQSFSLFLPLVLLWKWKRGREMSIDAEVSQQRKCDGPCRTNDQSVSMSHQGFEECLEGNKTRRGSNWSVEDPDNSFSHYSASYQKSSDDYDDDFDVNMNVGTSIRRWIPNTRPSRRRSVSLSLHSPQSVSSHHSFDPLRLQKVWTQDEIFEDTPMLSQLTDFAEKNFCLEMVEFCDAVLKYEKEWWPTLEKETATRLPDPLDMNDSRASDAPNSQDDVYSPFLANPTPEATGRESPMLEGDSSSSKGSIAHLPPSFLRAQSGGGSLKLQPLPLPTTGTENFGSSCSLEQGRESSPLPEGTEPNTKLLEPLNARSAKEAKLMMEKEAIAEEKRPPSADQMRQFSAVSAIYRDYICPGAPNEVNVSGDSRTELGVCVKEPERFFEKTSQQRCEIFQDLKEEVMKLLRLNLMQNFMRSQNFQKGLRGEMVGLVERTSESLMNEENGALQASGYQRTTASCRKHRVQPAENSITSCDMDKKTTRKKRLAEILWRYFLQHRKEQHE